MENLKTQVIETQSEIAKVIFEQKLVEVWMGDTLDDICTLVGFDETTVRTSEGYYYFKKNVTLITI